MSGVKIKICDICNKEILEDEYCYQSTRTFEWVHDDCVKNQDKPTISKPTIGDSIVICDSEYTRKRSLVGEKGVIIGSILEDSHFIVNLLDNSQVYIPVEAVKLEKNICEDCGARWDLLRNPIIEGDSQDGLRKVLRCARCWENIRQVGNKFDIQPILTTESVLPRKIIPPKRSYPYTMGYPNEKIIAHKSFFQPNSLGENSPQKEPIWLWILIAFVAGIVFSFVNYQIYFACY